MKINFKFNSKSSSQNIQEAKRLAEKCGGVLEGKLYSIDFDSFNDKDLEQLFFLIGHLKGSVITIDGSEPFNAAKLFNVVNCRDKLLCKGSCNHITFGYYPLAQFNLQYGAYIKEGVLSTSDPSLITQISKFLDPIDDTHFKVNKELYLKYLNEITELENQFCEKYDKEKIKEEIAKLPEKVELVSEERAFEQEEYTGDDTIIRQILSAAEIDDKFSFDEILDCSKSVSLLLNTVKGHYINNTDVLIYYHPYVNKFVLAKLKVLEDEFNNSDEEEEIADIITKEEGIYCIKDSYKELYFKAFDIQDGQAQKYYEFIRKM